MPIAIQLTRCETGLLPSQRFLEIGWRLWPNCCGAYAAYRARKPKANGFPEAADFIDEPNIRHELEDIADRPDRAKKRSDRFAKPSAF